MKIMLDPGHGGKDPGAVAANGLQEKDVALQVVLLLEEELEERGHQVVLTRRSDIFIPLERRAEMANREKAQLFISVHCNSAVNTEAQGMEVFHYTIAERSKAWAQKVLTSLAKKFPDHKNRGIKGRTFAVLRLTSMPAVLVELEFISHPGQAQFLDDPASQARLAEAIADGVGAATAS